MDAILKLQSRIAGKVTESRAILDGARAEDRPLNDEERQKNEAALAEIRKLEQQIADTEAQEQLEAKLAQSKRAATPEAAAKPTVQLVSVRSAEDGNQAMSFGLWLLEARDAAQGRGVGPRLEAGMREARSQGLNIANPADGGFLVTTDVSQTIFQRMYESGQVLSRCNKLPPLSTSADGISIPAVDETSRATGSRAGGVQGYWVSEGTAPTASKPKLREVQLKLNALACLGYATDSLLQHAAVLGQFMIQAFSQELSFLAENAVLRGTGAGQPQGIINSGALVSVSKETGQLASTILFENIVKMWARMWSRSRQNAVWFINQDIEPQLMSMALNLGTGGIPVYMPPGGLSVAPFGSIFGRPVIPIEYASTIGTVGDIVLADMSQYFVIDGGSPQSASSMHVAFSTFEEAFRVKYRVDGQSAWRTTLTPFQGSNTQSPFVALATRA